MGNEVRLGYMIWHSTFRLVFSIRGLIALLFSAYMMIMVAVIYDKLPETFFELIRVFTNDPELQFHWLFFDNAISKAVTIFVAPILIFDAVSGDRSDDRFGLILSRPITRTQYLLTKLISAFLAFGLVFLPIMALGYPAFNSILDTISPVSYFGTSLGVAGTATTTEYKTAIIHPGAKLSPGVTVGPYSIIEGDVSI